MRISRSGSGRAGCRAAGEGPLRRSRPASSGPSAALGEPSGRPHDLGARAVADGEVEPQVVAAGGLLHDPSTARRAPGASRWISPTPRTSKPPLPQLLSSRGSRAPGAHQRLDFARGRCQFSWLKAKSVSTPTPASGGRRSPRAPPSSPRGGRRARSGRPSAHRPLPSMIIAMWAGTGAVDLHLPQQIVDSSLRLP